MILNFYKFVLAFTYLFLKSASKRAAKRVFRLQVLGDSSYFYCVDNNEDSVDSSILNDRRSNPIIVSIN